MPWNKPKEVDSVELAFPGGVIGRYLPKKEEIPDEFFRDHINNKWIDLANEWFFEGINGIQFLPKPGIDVKTAQKHLKVCLGSFEPQHEHKIAGVSFLMSLWFEDVQHTGENG